MKFTVQSSAAVLGLIIAAEAAKHGHHSHGHGHSHHNHSVEKRGGSCQFPSDAGLVAVTPGLGNGGWAISPDQECKPGSYCPYACPPGQVSMQWDPKATSYSYPGSMNGGLYCDMDGNIQKPFPSKPYCQDGTGSVGVRNKCGSDVSFCQTVLPGNEAMLIPTLVQSLATLAVPDTSYWCETAAHFYINPPGFGTDTACVWGTSSNPYGNWSPYVAGANTDGDGNTFLKIGWNPIYLETTTPFRDVVPEFGIEIECEGNGCNGLPCKIDPAVNGVNEMVGSAEDGAGGAAFCVVTVPKGEKANIVVFDGSGSGSDDSSSSSSAPAPTTSSTVLSTSSSTTTTSTSSSSVSSVVSTSEYIPTVTPTSIWASRTITTPTHVPLFDSPEYTYKPGVLIETGSSVSSSGDSAYAMSTDKPEASSVPDESSAGNVKASMLSLVLGVVAAMI
ncbi:hypothetical protein FE257_005986 [Aspergillus nanangensis]|uniref:SUN domain protein n=1 Tax=Aspergillus nanangensis TaxID=2582783 RepID=A0AAD4GV51_ASPNN|nr:hypothetical protein FE257_005986 [Aspergillus nanangensis]